MNTMIMTPAVKNTDATTFQLTGTIYILWLSMKMDVSTALKFNFCNMVNPCLTTSPRIQGTRLLLLSVTEKVKKAHPYINFCELLSCTVGYARMNVIGSRTSFVIASVHSSIN